MLSEYIVFGEYVNLNLFLICGLVPLLAHLFCALFEWSIGEDLAFWLLMVWGFVALIMFGPLIVIFLVACNYFVFWFLAVVCWYFFGLEMTLWNLFAIACVAFVLETLKKRACDDDDLKNKTTLRENLN